MCCMRGAPCDPCCAVLRQVVEGKSVEQALQWAAGEASLPQDVSGAVQEVLAAQGTPFQGER
jgi:hypothetical protein